MNESITDKYKEAGVDVTKADKIVEEIKNISKKSQKSHVLPIPLGAFSSAYEVKFSEYTNPVILASTDGVGTKILLAKESSNWDGIGQDVVAMCLNDLICHGGKPLFFLDYISCSSLDTDIIKKIIQGIANACLACGTALIGGETAELPGLIMKGNFDVAGFSVGIVEAKNIWKAEKVIDGDILLGLPANGLHSNGFSLLRSIFKQAKTDIKANLNLNNNTSGNSITVAEIFLQPTKLYVSLLMALAEKFSNELGSTNNPIHAVANITGGGIEGNVKRIIPSNLQAKINTNSWIRPPIYSWIELISSTSSSMQLKEKDMWSVWNMGIGMVLSVAKESVSEVEKEITKLNEKVFRIGTVNYKKSKTDESVILFKGP